MQPICLAIDTTFDDTSVAVLKGHNEVLANLTLSQFKDHEAFGGVVPERASRKHLEVIHPVYQLGGYSMQWLLSIEKVTILKK